MKYRMIFVLSLCAIVLVQSTGFAVAAEEELIPNEKVATTEQKAPAPRIKIFETKNFTEVSEFSPYAQNGKLQFTTMASGDLDADGIAEIVTGAGKGYESRVRVYTAEGTLRFEFNAYHQNFLGGIQVAVTDLNGDGIGEIITVPKNSGGSHVKVFSIDGILLNEFFAFSASEQGGASITVGEFDPASPGLEIAVGSGWGMSPLVKIFSSKCVFLRDIIPATKQTPYGLQLASIDLNGDGISEIATSTPGDTPQVSIATSDGLFLESLSLYPSSFIGGFDLIQGKVGETNSLVSGAGFGGGAHVRFFNTEGTPIITPSFFPFTEYRGGLQVALADVLPQYPGNELIVSTQYLPLAGFDDAIQSIQVDLTTQKLVAYEFGNKKMESLVSTGVARYPTPEGGYFVRAKILEKNYLWSYGIDHPDNYDIKKVKHNLSFFGHFYLHGAYWHNNFGHRMSHGCVNLPLPFAEKLYNWAVVGAAVHISSSSK